MSLYTPVFPPLHEPNGSLKGSLESNSVVPFGKRNYVKNLRDVHLFLSTQNDVLSPPSRPNSPMVDYRVQKVKNKINDIISAPGDETPSGRWTRASQILKLGCVRGRPWSVSTANPCSPEKTTNWILPDEESEWIEWEENRRLKGKTNVSQRFANGIPATPESQKPRRGSMRSGAGRYPEISPRILHAAREKVRRWQASVVTSETQHVASYGTASGSIGGVEGRKRARERSQRSGTLEFTVKKPTAKSVVGKGKKSFLSHPVTLDSATSAPSHSPKTPTNTQNEPLDVTPADDDGNPSKKRTKTPSVKGDITKIENVPEMYLPPSFPVHLETSTPLPDSRLVIRTKPPPILPVLLSTPPPSIPANPPDDLQDIPAEPRATDEPLSLQAQISAVRQDKRFLRSFASAGDLVNDPPATPPAKRPRTLSQNSLASAPKHTKSISPNRALSDARHPLGAKASSQRPLDLPIPSNVDRINEPTISGDIQEFAKIPSPTKSVKSYFSAADSDPADSPMKANLLLESPVSPMLSYAQHPSVFLPQITSTQARKGSPTPGGMGYSSQFDVERHVDRVSELLEKDVDFDGWLRDVRTVEMSQD